LDHIDAVVDHGDDLEGIHAVQIVPLLGMVRGRIRAARIALLGIA